MSSVHYSQCYNSHLGGASPYGIQYCRIVAKDWNLGRHSLGNNVVDTVVSDAWQAHLGPDRRLVAVNYSDLLELRLADALLGLVTPSQPCEAFDHGINVVEALDVEALLSLYNSRLCCDPLTFCLHVEYQS